MPTYNPQTCYNDLVAEHKPPCPGDMGTGLSYHCNNFAETPAIHQFCAKKENTVYTPVQYTEAYNTTLCSKTEYNPTKCQEKTFANLTDLVNFLTSHPDFKARPCWCCCSCYAWGTPIAVPTGEKIIQDFQVGDEVSAGSITNTGGTLNVTWAAETVHFSSGTPPLPKTQKSFPIMVFVHYGTDDKSLIVTRDQIFLLSTGKLKQASMLTVHDELVAPDGSSVRINAVKLGEYSGGLHHIATKLEYRGVVDGHLLNSNGVITGDYTLQINPGVLGDQLETGPSIGDGEYNKENAAHAVGDHAYHHPDAPEEIPTPATLQVLTDDAAPIPDGAARFITEDQEGDIISNGHTRGKGSPAGKAAVQYIFSLYEAFYPDIEFYLDWKSIHPNAYAFEAYGRQHVVLAGGLVRVDGLYEEGLAVIIAHAAAAFVNPRGEGPPKRLLPRVERDYYGIGTIMRSAWQTNWNTIVTAGLAQIKALFGNITAENAGGNPHHPKADPSIECRETTMMYAQLGGDLPACTQPAPPLLLKVTGARTGTTTSGGHFVTVFFNEAVNQASAENLGNYALDPDATLTSATVDDGDPSRVTLLGDFADATLYTLVVSNVTSAHGAALDPDNDTAHFTTM